MDGWADSAGLLATALCSAQAADSEATEAAFCVELPPGDAAPEWIQLLPPGPRVAGRDGRAWRLEDPAAVAAASRASGHDLPLDWEHATELRAPRGEAAPAAGWLTALQARDGGVWGQVAWTERGREAVARREYRYVSPVFQYDRATKAIRRLTSAALTNRPNLALTALNREEDKPVNELLDKLRQALGLATDAGEEAILAAANQLRTDLETARNRAATPDLERFVPRADHDAALNRATAAEGKLAAAAREAREAEIAAAVEEALRAGKITPAAKDYHLAQCRAEGGLDRFKAYVEAAPETAGPSGLDGREPPAAGTALNADQARIAAMFDHSAEDLAKYAPADGRAGRS